MPIFIWAAVGQGVAKAPDGELEPWVIAIATFFSVIPWIMVLSTAWTNRHQYEDDDT